MRALRILEPNRLDLLGTRHIAMPEPGPGEVLVRVHAASINPSDVKNAQGAFADTTLPRTPGRDFAGVVAHGPAALAGQAVWGAGGDLGFTREGSHAEYLAVPAAGVRIKPAGLSMAAAAASGVAFVTAYAALIATAGVRAGETVLITGARGSVGGAGMQIAAWAGARPIGIDQAESGRIGEIARDAAGGRGVDVVFDCVGGAIFEAAQRTLGRRGRQVCITSAGERRVSFDLLDFYHRELRLYGLDTRAMDSVAGAAALERLAPGFDSGALRAPDQLRGCTLEEAPEMYRALARGEAPGKMVIEFP